MAPGRYNLRPRGPTSTLEGRDVSADHTDIVEPINLFISAQTESITQLIAMALTQSSVKQGIRLFGDKAMEAINKEMLQLYTREVLLPRKKKQLTSEQLKKVLEYIMTIKEKNDGTVKGRGCADGR